MEKPCIDVRWQLIPEASLDIIGGDIGTGGFCPGGFCPGGDIVQIIAIN